MRLFSNYSTWATCLDPDTRSDFDSDKSPMVYRTKPEGQAIKLFIAAWTPNSIQSGNGKQFLISDGRCCIAWTIVPPMRPKDGLSWKPVDHWSTLSLGQIPDTGSEFFSSFIQDVKDDWLRLCALAQDHLSSRVSSFQQVLHVQNFTNAPASL